MYKRKTIDVWFVEINHDGKWTALTCETTKAEALYLAKQYRREIDPYSPMRISKSRQPLKGITAD